MFLTLHNQRRELLLTRINLRCIWRSRVHIRFHQGDHNCWTHHPGRRPRPRRYVHSRPFTRLYFELTQADQITIVLVFDTGKAQDHSLIIKVFPAQKGSSWASGQS